MNQKCLGGIYMKFSMVADIMFVAPGEHGPVWPDTDGVIEAMKLAKENGLDGIEMFDYEGRDLDKLNEAAKDLGLEFVSFCAKNGKLWGVPDKIDEFEAGFVESIPAAKKLNCKNLIISDDMYDRDLPREKVHEGMVAALKRIAPIAEREDVVVLVEPLSGAFFKDSKEAFDILKEVGSDNIKLLYDIFHFQLIEGNITNTIKENVDLIGHIHGAGAPMRCELTVGELNYEFILNEIKETGYDKFFGLEFFTFADREKKVAVSAELVRK